LFSKVRVVAVIGSDFPEAELEALTSRGVDLAGIERREGKTFRWEGRYSDDLLSRQTLNTELNVFADFAPKLPPAYRDSRIVVLGNIHPELQLDVLGQVQNPELVVADTMDFWIRGEPRALGKVLERLHLLVINDEELRLLAGDHNVSRAARAVLGRGPKKLIVKRGEYGAMCFDQTHVFFAPAFPLEEVVDPTGAGDSFLGGVVGHLAETGHTDARRLRRAVTVGATVASFCVEDVGPSRLKRLTRQAVAERLDLLHQMMTTDD
jgi:sugar/nucleoside kinase (ribokinase family)